MRPATLRRAVVAALLVAAVPAAAQQPPAERAPAERHRLAFATFAGGLAQARKAEVLIESIRRFGGPYAGAPVVAVVDNRDSVPADDLRRAGARVLDLEMDAKFRGWPFAEKVFAAAQVERLVAGSADTLAWFDAETLVLRPPAALDLAAGKAVAMRPVFLVNTIGIAPDQPYDGFWRGVLGRAGVDPAAPVPTVEAFVKGEPIRFYVNCGIIAFRADRGIAREWARVMTALLGDEPYLREHCADGLHKVFLHQAALSAVLLARTTPSERRWLPADHGYPLGQHASLPPGKAAKRLDDLACLIHDTLWDERPDWMATVAMSDGLRAWVGPAFDRTFRVTDRIFREERSCNSYLVRTAAGDLVIDPGGAGHADSRLLAMHRGHPLAAILLTHGHEDHRGGIALWKGGRDVPVVAQRRHAELLADQDRIAGFLARRNAVIAGKPLPAEPMASPATPVEATEFFDERRSLTVGDLHVELIHTPGETPDTTTIWIPELRAVWVGDNFFTAFPNLSTPRGSKPRWALEYVAALDAALALEPALLLPGHDDPILGAEAVKRRLTRYRDAILTVHDAVVAGLNAGKDVRTLMREVALPEALALPQFFGRVSWSVRGIAESYVGWFDGDPANLYDRPANAIYPDLAGLAGGPDAIARRAAEAVASDPLRALQLTDVALAAAPAHREALGTRLAALRALRAASANYFERRCLDAAIRQANTALEAAAPTREPT